MKVSIDLGFFVCFRSMLVVIGKIEKSTVQRLEMSEREFSVFSSRILLESGSHLPGERAVSLFSFAKSCFLKVSESQNPENFPAFGRF
mgnify:CR=1 FL=1